MRKLRRTVQMATREDGTRSALQVLAELGLGDKDAGTLRALPAGAWLDLAFIDADRAGLTGYWEEIVPRTRPGGVILVDNVLLHGRIGEILPPLLAAD